MFVDPSSGLTDLDKREIAIVRKTRMRDTQDREVLPGTDK